MADNLMDLSHAEFLHVQSFGTNGSLLKHGKQSVVNDETGAIWNNWDMERVAAPGWAAGMLEAGALVDQWIHMRWHAPSTMALEIGLARAGSERKELVVPTLLNPHILTPETDSSCWYFFTHEPTPEGAALARRVFQEEDEPMVHAVQESMAGGDFWEQRPVVLPSDAAAIRARRRLMRLRDDEAHGASLTV